MRTLLLLLLTIIATSCKESEFKTEWTKEQAPETFTAVFETTKGDFEIEVTRSWSPHAADRLYQLIKHNYYENAIFYRVVPDFVAQFGNTDVNNMEDWRSVAIPDEPVLHSNTRGTVSFARFGKDSRDLEVFINLKDNTVLDTLDFEGVKGFTPLGNVKKGMEVVEALYSGYAEEPMADSNLYKNRSLFYQTFPKLDLIKKTYLIEKD
ncbi:peptidylprolyl isomerase [Flavobacterium terrisoli]|uniref:peptidylprolyl isomerase n=1 Tax=Flavobacterium terrisoli TaxID=3242195 RepID=UPI0025426F38|nr:peptidylprolyl isomerase [Flavobacterium buctense]